MKVGLYGGSFDPIHLGHLITAQYVLEERNLARIIFMPCYISPLKTDYNYIPAVHRLKMIQLAIESFSSFEVSDFEIQKENISYTIETILELRKQFNHIELIIGYDNLLVFDKWKDPDLILQNAKLIVMKRKFSETSRKNIYFEQAIFIDTPLIEISSTSIRERVKQNKDISFLVGDKVNKYILENNLYK
ncbi:MAG: nicotinate-nucleotide adenylyltransferase [Ignavibacteriales bacterium]